MHITKLTIPDVLKITPQVFADERGFFFERFTAAALHEHGVATTFVQDNISQSKKNVLRGLHYQLPPYGQAKFVYVTHGRVLDVAVDIRQSSPTFGQYIIEELSDENNAALYIPEGFAHGFVTLSDMAVFQYKVSNYYSPEHDRGITWHDPDIGIAWPIDTPLVSDKDSMLPLLTDISSEELYE